MNKGATQVMKTRPKPLAGHLGLNEYSRHSMALYGVGTGVGEQVDGSMWHVVGDMGDVLTVHVRWEQRQGPVFVLNLLDGCSKLEFTLLGKLVAKVMP
jgi:hypothetical protein